MTVCERGRIDSALAEIESRHGCRVLFAVESGSRAWGFASPDSDYDVRGVYVKSLDWYLQLQSGEPDAIVENFPGDIDIALWDLRNAAGMFTVNVKRCSEIASSSFPIPRLDFIRYDRRNLCG